jgi:uncharacterized phage protein gp47/JayE
VTLARPTLAELVQRSETELATRLGLGALLERSVLKVLARVWAGGVHGLYGYLDWVAAQVVPLTAEAEVLDRWGELFGLPRLAAARASGSVTFTGTSGVAVALGTVVQRADGRRFVTTAGGTIAAGTLTLEAEAELAGLDGNTAAGTTLALAAPLAGVTAVAAATGGLVNGLDAETDQGYRARLQAFVSARPQGGSEADYEAWAREVPGVTRVFVLANGLGLGTVLVLFTVDDDPAGPIPGAAKVQEVQDRMTDQTRRDSAPVCAQVTTQAPVAQPVSVTLQLTPNTLPVQEAVKDALRGMLFREGRPGATIRREKFVEAIATAAGEQDHVLAVPAADVVVGAASVPLLDVVTFT